MKIYLMFIVGLLIVSSVEHQVCSTVVGCSSQNEFLKGLREEGVQTFTAPTFYPRVCGGEWEKYGGCCDQDSINRYVKRDSEKLEKFSGIVLKEMANAKDDFTKLLSNQKNLGNFVGFRSPKVKSGQTVSESESQKSKDPELEVSKNTKISLLINKTSELVEVLNEAVETYPQINKKCTDQIKHMRSSSVCYMCSGRSYSFQIKNRLAVNEPMCQSFVDSCFDSWRIMGKVLMGIESTRQVLIETRELIKDFVFPYKDIYVEGMTIWQKGTGLWSNLAQCNEKTKKCPTNINIEICKAVLNLGQSTFVEDEADMMLFGRKSASIQQKKEFGNLKTNFQLRFRHLSIKGFLGSIEKRRPIIFGIMKTAIQARGIVKSKAKKLIGLVKSLNNKRLGPLRIKRIANLGKMNWKIGRILKPQKKNTDKKYQRNEHIEEEILKNQVSGISDESIQNIPYQEGKSTDTPKSEVPLFSANVHSDTFIVPQAMALEMGIIPIDFSLSFA